jgi:hypothetical protein
MRTNDILINENSSPYMKRLVLMKRAGIRLTNKQKNRLNESVSQILPMKYHDRMGIQGSMMKQFKDLDDDEELDLSEFIDDDDSDNDSEIFDAILKEMGYGVDEEEDESIKNMEDITQLTDNELEEIITELELDVDDINEFNVTSKGYKEARKVVDKLRRDIFRKLSDEELDEFMNVISNSFDLQRK